MNQENRNMKRQIQTSLRNLAGQTFFADIVNFWNILGYESQRQPEKQQYSYAEFKQTFDQNNTLNDEKTKAEEWHAFHLLFQITKSELPSYAQTDISEDKSYQPHLNSYVFAALDLKKDNYSRGALAEITRQINRCFMVPMIISFRYGDKLTIAVIGRRVNRRDLNKDVLLKVTLIKDIELLSPHRAHIDILFDLSLEQLIGEHTINNFDDLHKAWEKTLDLNELNKRFYQELSYWYFWAIQEVEFPAGEEENRDIRNSISVIRLITRMFFVWFMKEKGLVPEALFEHDEISNILNFKDFNDSTYYKAILQNLFFATFNSEMEIDGKPVRKFRAGKENWKVRKNEYMQHGYFRYEKYFNEPDEVIANYFQEIPFLNGGLFECLDHDDENKKVIRIDGFSDRDDNVLKVPDKLFLKEDEEDVDLNHIFETTGESYKVKGLLSILHSYKFTVAENTPIEEEVALDPELLGRVFENLLASYNPETRTSARKETGSFYTPRIIVDYMVDESLIIHMQKALNKLKPENAADNELRLQLLFAYADEEHLFTDEECGVLIDSIDNLRAIDPACGSGAFPMGLLLKMVYILHKLDPDNEKWKNQQINRLNDQIKAAKDISDYKIREEVIKRLEESKEDIENTFKNYDFDYSRKLFLIENCLYGVDIQPIAIQIAKLRFFLSLLVDEHKKENEPNYGIRALPNMETKLIAADSLLHLGHNNVNEIFSLNLDKFKDEIKNLQREYFTARTRKHKYELRERNREIRERFAEELIALDASPTIAEKIANWDPFKTNEPADFMDLGVMFGIDNVNLVITNPPYIRHENIPNQPELREAGYKVYNNKSDLYTYFYEQAYNMLDTNGISTFISSNTWMKTKYGKKLRNFFKNKTKLINLIDFGGYQIFGSAVVNTNILIFQKKEIALNHRLKFANIDISYKGENITEYFHGNKSTIVQRQLEDIGWTLFGKNVLALKEKIEAAGKPLRNWDVDILYGIKTGYNPAFIIDTINKERICAEDPNSATVIKQLLRGKDIKKYRCEWADKWLIRIPKGWTDENRKLIDAETFFKSKYPGIHKHLIDIGNQPIIGNGRGLYLRDDQGDYWWELRACSYYDEFDKIKIIYPNMTKYLPFIIDDQGYYTNQKCYILTVSNEILYSLLGLLNSKLIHYYIKLTFPMLQGDTRELNKNRFELIPIENSFHKDKRLSECALQLHNHYRNNSEPNDEILSIEEEIDQIVYNLYNLDSDDIEMIESFFRGEE